MRIRQSANSRRRLRRAMSPRTALLAVVAAGPALAGLGTAAVASSTSWASVSGLSWRSGAHCGDSGWENFRHRRNDVYVEFVGRRNWSDVVRKVSNYLVRTYRGKAGRLSIGMPMLTDDMRGQWSRCTSGALDGHLRDIGNALRNGGLGNAIIRLGWEANGSGFPWNIRGRVSEYKACFRHEVHALKSAASGLLIDWTMKKTTEGSVGAQELYPGDGYVDIIGVNFYDNYPRYTSDAVWQSDYNATYRGGPKGLGTWLQFARSHGKKLSIPEWAVWNNTSGGDNPLFIQKMHDTFRQNAGSIAYESYFNCLSQHQIYTAGRNPRASSKYRQLWAGG
jgi:hypothetical protein